MNHTVVARTVGTEQPAPDLPAPSTSCSLSSCYSEQDVLRVGCGRRGSSKLRMGGETLTFRLCPDSTRPQPSKLRMTLERGPADWVWRWQRAYCVCLDLNAEARLCAGRPALPSMLPKHFVVSGIFCVMSAAAGAKLINLHTE